MNWDEYDQINGVSSSGVRCFATQGPYRYYHEYVLKTVKRDYTDSLRKGHALHLAMQYGDDWLDHVYYEPEVIKDDWAFHELAEGAAAHFAVGKPINRKSPVHRQYIQLLADKAKDKLTLRPEDIMRAEQQRQAIYDNPACWDELLQHVIREEVFTRLDESNLMTKCMIDAITEDFSKALDFKTTRWTQPNEFISHALRLGYHYQAEFYCRVTGAEEFRFISVTSDPPFESMLYVVPESLMEQARDSNTNHLKWIKDCQDSDSWHTLGWGAELEFTLEQGKYAV